MPTVKDMQILDYIYVQCKAKTRRHLLNTKIIRATFTANIFSLPNPNGDKLEIDFLSSLDIVVFFVK